MVSEDATLCPALTRGPQTSFVTEGGGTGQLGSRRKYEEGGGGLRGDTVKKMSRMRQRQCQVTAWQVLIGG